MWAAKQDANLVADSDARPAAISAATSAAISAAILECDLARFIPPRKIERFKGDGLVFSAPQKIDNGCDGAMSVAALLASQATAPVASGLTAGRAALQAA